MAFENWKVGGKILITQILTSFLMFGVSILILLSDIFSKLAGKILLVSWIIIALPFSIWFGGLIGKKLWKWK